MPPINPDETLKVITDLANRMSETKAAPTPDEAARLAHLVLVLDEHLRTGGVTPARWSAAKTPTSSEGPVRSSEEGDLAREP